MISINLEELLCIASCRSETIVGSDPPPLGFSEITSFFTVST